MFPRFPQIGDHLIGDAIKAPSASELEQYAKQRRDFEAEYAAQTRNQFELTRMIMDAQHKLPRLEQHHEDSELIRTLRDALERAGNRLDWYLDRYPEASDGSDDEFDAYSESAIAAADARLTQQALPSGAMVPLETVGKWWEHLSIGDAKMIDTVRDEMHAILAQKGGA